jgi:hypothetical protein
MQKKTILVVVVVLATIATVFAQTAADFNVELTDDGAGVRIKGYTGKVTAVKIPATIEGMPVREIGKGAFFNSNITSVTFPAGLTTIGERAFSACPELTDVVIPDSVTTIGVGAFGSSFTAAGQRTPQKTGLTSVRLPRNLTTLEAAAFSDCSSLTSVTFTGTALTEIPDFAFDGTALKTIIIPDVVTTIGEFAFWRCENLTSVTLGASITTIGDSAFLGCSSLATVTIPDSVEKLTFLRRSGRGEDTAFYYCPKLGIGAQAAIKKRGYTGSF